MTDVFPPISTVSIKDADAGSIVMISRSEGPVLALTTDHFTNGVRSFVLLNIKIRGERSVIFAENWRGVENVLRFDSSVRFEIDVAAEEIDAGRNSRGETPGIIVSIADQLYIRAAPAESFRGLDRLVNIRTGSVFPEYEPNSLWSFSKWKLLLRDNFADRDIALMEFSIRTPA
jgi:hypothetical protein